MVFLSVTLGVPFSVVREMSAAEISLYQAYFKIDPWGEERADLRNAMAMHQTAEMHRDRKRQPNAFNLMDFMPFRRKPDPEPSEVREKVRDAFGRLKKLSK